MSKMVPFTRILSRNEITRKQMKNPYIQTGAKTKISRISQLKKQVGEQIQRKRNTIQCALLFFTVEGRYTETAIVSEKGSTFEK